MSVASTRNGSRGRRQTSPAAERSLRVAEAWFEIFAVETAGVARDILRNRVSAGRDAWHRDVFAALGRYTVDAVRNGDRGVRANSAELLRLTFMHDPAVVHGRKPPVATRYTDDRVREMRHHWRQTLGSGRTFRGTRTKDVLFVIDNPAADARDGDLVIMVAFEGEEPTTRDAVTRRLPGLHTLTLPVKASEERLKHLTSIARSILVEALPGDRVAAAPTLARLSLDTLRLLVEEASTARAAGSHFDLARSIARHAPDATGVLETPEVRKKLAIQRAIDAARPVLKRQDQEALRAKLQTKTIEDIEANVVELERASRKGRPWLLQLVGLILIGGCILYGALKVRGLFRTEVDTHGNRVVAADMVVRDGKIAATDREGKLLSQFSGVGLDDADGAGSVRVEKAADGSTKFLHDAPEGSVMSITWLPSSDAEMGTTDVRWLSDLDGVTPEQAILKTPDPVVRPRYVQIMFVLDRASFAGPPIAHMYSIDFGCGHTMIPSVRQVGSSSYLFGGHHLYENDGIRTVTLKSTPRNPFSVLRQSRIRVNGSHQALFADGAIGHAGINLVQWLSRPMDAEVKFHPPDREQRIDRFRYVARRDCSDGLTDCHPSVVTTPWSTGAPLSFTPDQPGRWILILEFRRDFDPIVQRSNPSSLTVTAFVPSSRG